MEENINKKVDETTLKLIEKTSNDKRN